MKTERPVAVSFDCYGTLIDWEAGILSSLRPLLAARRILPPDSEILSFYASTEPELQGGDYRPYREVLRGVVEAFGKAFGFQVTDDDRECLVRGLPEWQPFPDTVEALKTLKGRYKLSLISNVDHDLLRSTMKHLPVLFDWITTAEEVRAYKPSQKNFQRALQKMKLRPSQMLHVAESTYHDIAPASQLGIPTVWVRRREEAGASRRVPATPHHEISSLKGLLEILR